VDTIKWYVTLFHNREISVVLLHSWSVYRLNDKYGKASSSERTAVVLL
jgi:hypothetical protein